MTFQFTTEYSDLEYGQSRTSVNGAGQVLPRALDIMRATVSLSQSARSMRVWVMTDSWPSLATRITVCHMSDGGQPSSVYNRHPSHQNAWLVSGRPDRGGVPNASTQTCIMSDAAARVGGNRLLFALSVQVSPSYYQGVLGTRL